MRKKNINYLIMFIICFFLSAQSGYCAKPDLHLYLDADLTHSFTSSHSIEQGIRTALSEINNQINGHTIKLILSDHRGNSRRSLDNLKVFLNDDRALAVFGGLHSPPLLANLKFINDKGILHLIPWAAAGPITRFNNGTNWVFRLSIDDSKAGEILVKHVTEYYQAKRPALLLEETGWGRSNAKTINISLTKRNMINAGIFWFKWGTKENSARIILRKIIQSGADSILLVANAPEGKLFVKAMAGFPEKDRIPFSSHWGITGGDFPKVVTLDLRNQVELSFLQTRFSFLSGPVNPLAQNVFNQAKFLFPDDIQTPGDIKAPTGFIHAYDLTKILIAAIQKAGLTKDIKRDRAMIRDALESLDKPIPGLIKTYRQPFSPFNSDRQDAHEALSMDDFKMGRYDEKDRIVLIQ